MNAFMHALRWDWRLLRRSGVGVAAGLLSLLLAALAAWSGLNAGRDWQTQVTAAQVLSEQRQDTLLADTGDDGSAAAYSARGLIVLPPAPLADIAVGRSDLDPRVAEASTFGQTHTLFSNYQIGSPLALALGRFDLAFFVQVLLPLLVVALGYGLFAEERERGLDRVLAVQGVSARRLLLARVLARAVLVLGPLLAVLAVLFFLDDAALGAPAQRAARFALAALLIVGYAAFWWALAAWIGTWRLREGQTLLVLLSAWVLLVLVLPAVAGLIARDAHRAPSRFELIAAARAQEIAGTLRSEALLGEYAHDHPDMDAAAAANLPGWAKSVFVVSRQVDAEVAPVVARFDAALAAQQRLVERWQYASPALIVQRGLMTAAGTDERRQAAFRDQAQAYFQHFREHTGAMMLDGETLNAQNLATMPRFAFAEPPLAATTRMLVAPLAALWLLAALLLVLALRRAGRDAQP